MHIECLLLTWTYVKSPRPEICWTLGKPYLIWAGLKRSVKSLLEDPSMKVYDWVISVKRILLAVSSSWVFTFDTACLQRLVNPLCVLHIKHGVILGCSSSRTPHNHVFNLYVCQFFILSPTIIRLKDSGHMYCGTPYHVTVKTQKIYRANTGYWKL